MRYLGFCPRDLSSVLKEAAFYVGRQIMVPAEALSRYPEREQTSTYHLRRVYEHLCYRRPSPDDLRGLFGWLNQRALEHGDAFAGGGQAPRRPHCTTQYRTLLQWAP